MVMLGKVGQVILDFQDDIIAEYNSVKDEFKDEISNFNKEIWALEKKVREMNSEIDVIENDNLMEKVESDGIEFKVDEEKLYTLPDLDVRFDWTVKNIQKIKVTGKTKSGKSCDLELVTVRKNWNSEKDEYETVYYTNTYERVRMDKISHLVSWNKDIIVD
jgi:ABC-type transport system involved in cytochrome bd biosynthesis fused ATPase/permease subunit